MSHRRQGHPLRETRIVDMYMARADLILWVEYVLLYILLSLGSNSLESQMERTLFNTYLR